MQEILVWLQEMEKALAGLGPIPADTEAVKAQMEKLKSFKEKVHPKHIDIQFLNQTAADLIKDSPTEAAGVIREPMADVNRRWDTMLDRMSDRRVSL